MMNREEALKLLTGGTVGVQEWNRRREAGEGIPDLSEADLSEADLFEAHLSGANLSRANLSQSNLSHADLSRASLSQSNLRHADLSQSNLSYAGLSQSHLIEADLSRANLRNAILSGANLSNAVLSHADLSEAHLSGAHLIRADLSGADLRNADLSAANLKDADLRDVKVDGDTKLKGAKVADCQMYRHTLEMLEKYGELTKADRMGMNIIDGLAKLRASYSGFMQWLHLIALLVFLFPYVSFILKQWAIARFLPSAEDTMELWQALGYYIWNGGEGWQQGLSLNPWSFGAFCVALIYNIMRIVLLFKTKKLEMQQEAIGLPVVFKLGGFLGLWHRCRNIVLWLNLLAVAWHTWHFMTQRVPIDVATT